jgi:hypothetical protein
MAAEAGVLVGELNERRLSDLDGAVAAYRLVVEQLGDTKSAQKAREHLARLESIDLGLDVPRTFAPGEPVRVGLPDAERQRGRVPRLQTRREGVLRS